MKVLLMIMIVGYLLGCLHGSQIVGKYKKINIKKSGSKNSGASNATLVLGWRYGLIVAIVDIGKAIVSLLITMYILDYFQVADELVFVYLLISGLFVIIGHNYPLTMSFNGGKGTASFFGFLLYFNWKLAIVCLFIALIISFLTNYFVIGTLSGYLTFNLYIIFIYTQLPIFLSFIFTSLFLIKHVENFRRIMNDEEMKLRTFFRKEAS